MTKVGAILVQYKNRARRSKPSQLLGEGFFTVSGPRPRQDSMKKSFDNVISNNPSVKILSLLFDFGRNDISLEVSYSKAVNPRIWAIYSKGSDGQIFACIDSLHVRNEVRTLFLDVLLPVKDDEIAVTYHEDHVDIICIKKMEIFGLCGGQPKLNKKVAVLEDPFQLEEINPDGRQLCRPRRLQLSAMSRLILLAVLTRLLYL
jgi:hypothetical protein